MLGRVPSTEASDEHAQAVFDLNARSVVSMTRAATPWLDRNGGFVINTTSIAARNGGGGGAVLYAAAKGFVSTLTRGQAKELIGKGIRVNASRAGRYRDAVPRPLLGRRRHGGDAQDCSRSGGLGRRRNASARISSSRRRR